ncbi:MAG: molybdate ABC transporter permease subunit [Myxococcota bacterium]|nr:molybdate ABC transporter permease subunit [Deltaproteobacteria bacterium]MDQ3335096.1 molybdate ABC transporter permease subunit [Myxococcota bacterium]
MEWDPLLLSFKVAAISTIAATIIGVAFATLLTKRFPGRDILDVLLTTPMVLPPTVLGYYVLVVLGRRSWIGETYEDIFGSSIVFTQKGAVIAAAIGALPLIVKAARAALEGVDPTLLRAARTLGASKSRAYFTVALPLAAPGVLAGVMLGFARALGDFGVTLMVAGDIPGETQTASLAIYDAIQGNRQSDAAGMIAVLSAFAIVTLYVVNKLTRKPHED